MRHVYLHFLRFAPRAHAFFFLSLFVLALAYRFVVQLELPLEVGSFLSEKVTAKGIPFLDLLLGPIINGLLGPSVKTITDYVTRK